MQRDWHESLHVGTHIVFIDINAERRKGGGRGERRGFGLFRGRIEKFNRRTRSDALVMHRSGANLLSARCESEMEERKRRGDSLARREHGAPSSSNYQAFISWKTSLSLSLSLCFVYCHRWPFRSSVWCNQKNRASKDWSALLAWEKALLFFLIR